jgi:hypothetical protein
LKFRLNLPCNSSIDRWLKDFNFPKFCPARIAGLAASMPLSRSIVKGCENFSLSRGCPYPSLTPYLRAPADAVCTHGCDAEASARGQTLGQGLDAEVVVIVSARESAFAGEAGELFSVDSGSDAISLASSSSATFTPSRAAAVAVARPGALIKRRGARSGSGMR